MLGTKLLVNSSRVHLYRWNKRFADMLPAGSLVLDAGAGEQPYRELFGHTQYESADFERVDKPYAKSTYVCDLTAIPVEMARFDAVICNQVLAHLPRPIIMLKEVNRILKPGGHVIFTMPLFYEETEAPFDFYRYTQFAHRYMFKEAGFEINQLEWMEGYFGTVAYQLEMAGRRLPLRPADIGGGTIGIIASPFMFILKVFSLLAAAILYRLDIRHRYTAKGMPKNYVVIAQKPLRNWAAEI